MKRPGAVCEVVTEIHRFAEQQRMALLIEIGEFDVRISNRHRDDTPAEGWSTGNYPPVTVRRRDLPRAWATFLEAYAAELAMAPAGSIRPGRSLEEPIEPNT